MDFPLTLLDTLPAFAAYFFGAVVFVVLFMWIYALLTPHEEKALIKEGNAAAATAYCGTLLGVILPVASVVTNSVSLVDFAVWSCVAGAIQILTFLLFRLAMPKISERIRAGEIAAALVLASVSLGVGILNAASMTY